MAPNYKAELVGVFGHPIAENPTVVMEEAAFAALGLNWRYLTIEVMPDDLEDAIKGLRAFGMRGCNLTIPHKVAVIKYLDEVRPAAALMGAVNCVIRDGDRLIGDNTDGKGFMTALTKDAAVSPGGKNVVVLGAGGAARAITVELALAGAASLTVVNRSEERGRELVELLCTRTPLMAEYAAWTDGYRIPEGTDILVNATSIGLPPKDDERPDIDYATIRPGMIVCDVIPGPTTPFLEEAKRRGATAVDGLGMLVYQGVIGIKLWSGQDADPRVMYDALMKAFGLAS